LGLFGAVVYGVEIAFSNEFFRRTSRSILRECAYRNDDTARSTGQFDGAWMIFMRTNRPRREVAERCPVGLSKNDAGVYSQLEIIQYYFLFVKSLFPTGRFPVVSGTENNLLQPDARQLYAPCGASRSTGIAFDPNQDELCLDPQPHAAVGPHPRRQPAQSTAPVRQIAKPPLNRRAVLEQFRPEDRVRIFYQGDAA
jgi:hypothetical protein